VSRVLVAGARGLLGAAIVRELSGAYTVTAPDRQALDITDDAALARACAEVRPQIIINCAAYNDVDRAEEDVERALAVNAFAVLALSRQASANGATFVHYSSDFVFDGLGARPYTEQDAPNPRSAYAASKLLGDWFALEHPSAYVLRVESLFGEPGPGGRRAGSLGTIVSRIRAGEETPVFVDRTVSPGYTADVARATRELLARGAPPGLYHCVNSGTATWVEIAEEAARLLDRPLTIKPITLETAALRASLPKYCALSNRKLQDAGIAMPDWRDALARFLK
jgi:dTDP-4-dehydrorhamnose reductase